MFIVTDKWLESNRTSAGGYNSPQVLALGWEDGIATPDWKNRSIGMSITPWQKKLFETLVKYKQQSDKPVTSSKTPKKKKKPKQLDPIAVQEQQRVLTVCRAHAVEEAPWG